MMRCGSRGSLLRGTMRFAGCVCRLIFRTSYLGCFRPRLKKKMTAVRELLCALSFHISPIFAFGR